MSTVATSTTADLPSCREAATTRIEVFGDPGKLDGVMYLCDTHTPEFLEVSGDTKTRCTALPDDDIRCGEGWDFVAGRPIDAPETPEDSPSFKDLVEAYRLGQAYGTQLGRDTLELLERIDSRLRNAAQECEKAYDDGYTDGLSAAEGSPR